MSSKNAAKTQQVTEQKVSVEYGEELDAGTRERMKCVLAYGRESDSYGCGCQRATKPTFGLVSYYKDTMIIPSKARNDQFIVGSDLEEMVVLAGMKGEQYIDVWRTTAVDDEQQEDKVYRCVTGTIRCYDIKAKRFGEEKVVTERFLMADPERDARNAAQQAKAKRYQTRHQVLYKSNA